MSRNVKIKKNEDNPESPEVLADSIIRIADGFKKLMSDRLTDYAVIALLKDMPGMQTVGKTEIRLVLQNLKKIKSYYIRENPKK